MKELTLIFQGDVHIAIQGNNALSPIDQNHQNSQNFYIGSAGTNLVIRDHRSRPIFSSQPVWADNMEHDREIFQRSAWAEVRYREQDEVMEIDLHDSEGEGDLPILWLGVLEDNLMPGYKVEWEVFKELSPDRTAFAALVP